MTLRLRIAAFAAAATAGALLLTACSSPDTVPAQGKAGATTPALAAVEQPAPGQLIALTADSRVLSGSDGTSWTERGRLPGGVQGAVLTAAGPDHLLAADSNDAVHKSTDGGRTWTTVHQGGHTSTGH
ncbi:hypothetical protein ACFVP3_39460 [Streptomyces sp. NPDC057806]|uniref:hypothetical protein n=1 Tax=Streptomyces sp. NPDC057806 TaxID=3346255 RepID=UPI0036CFBE7B